MLNRDGLSRFKPQAAPVEVDGVGEVLIRKMTAGEWLHVQGLFNGKDSGSHMQAMFHMVHVCARQDDGSPLFASPEEVGELSEDVATAVIKAVSEANGFRDTQEDQEAPKG